MNVAVFVNILQSSRVCCWTANFCDLASKDPAIIMNQLKSINHSPFKNSHSHPIHTCFLMIAGNGSKQGVSNFFLKEKSNAVTDLRGKCARERLPQFMFFFNFMQLLGKITKMIGLCKKL